MTTYRDSLEHLAAELGWKKTPESSVRATDVLVSCQHHGHSGKMFRWQMVRACVTESSLLCTSHVAKLCGPLYLLPVHGLRAAPVPHGPCHCGFGHAASFSSQIVHFQLSRDQKGILHSLAYIARTQTYTLRQTIPRTLA